MKARVWTPGCAIQAFDIPVADAEVEVQFVCDPQPPVPFRGRVAGPLNFTLISAQYWGKCPLGPSWELQTTCLFPMFVATAKLEADGSFNMDLPDFKADRLVSSDSSAVFKFLLRTEDGGVHFVKPEKSKDSAIPVASSYPEDLTFVLLK